MYAIHPTAVVDPRAKFSAGVSVGAYSVVKGEVEIGHGTSVGEHCHIHGHTVVGKNCAIGPGAFLGFPPQHAAHSGEGTSLLVGDDVVIREMASVHRATLPGLAAATRIGNRCFLMAATHVGHDCVVGDDVVLAHGAVLGGHVTVESRCFIGGASALHQWVRIGSLAIVGGNEVVTRDVPPFAAVWCRGLKGYNAVGCRRWGLALDVTRAIRAAYHCIHSHRSLAAALEEIRRAVPRPPEIDQLLEFFRASRRGVTPSLRARGVGHRGSRDARDDLAQCGEPED